MAILTASNLVHSFGSLDLFHNISVAIPADGKVGLVGPNGVGKTTLLMILAGLSQPSAGSVHRARGRRLGYLPQESAQAFADQDSTVYSEMLTIFAGLRKEEARLRKMEEEMATGTTSEEFLVQYGDALERFELAGGYDYEVRIKQVLQGLGFSQEERDLKLGHLSGGQKTRALLARLLLEQPDLLILDEPTNHLDVQAIEWLENTLRLWEGAVLLVSHDRYFLNKVVNTIWEMNPGGIELYRGNYNAYAQQRVERWALRRQAFESQKEKLEKELDYIRRNIAGQRTQMAKGKLSRISRQLDAMQRGGWDVFQGKSWSQVAGSLGKTSRRSMRVAEATAAVKQLQRPDGERQTFDINLKSSRRSGRIVLRAYDLIIGYPDKPLFQIEEMELHRLECAALIGPNGTGKTTFLRTILGKLEQLSGEIRLGASLQIGYFAQAHEQLDPDNSVMDELLRHHAMPISKARNYLARYLFQSDDIYKPVRALSGGERGRLALAILALEGANLLLLDEPTNHLDIPAQEMLQDVLEHFEGTIILVSHDRYLVDRLATQIWNLNEGRLDVYPGPYQEYLAKRERQAVTAKEVVSRQRDIERKQDRQKRSKANAKKERAARMVQVEQLISDAEAKLEELGQAIQHASSSDSFDKILSLSIEYATMETQTEKLLAEWENLAREETLA